VRRGFLLSHMRTPPREASPIKHVPPAINDYHLLSD
jgi:hypothetical protein